MRGLTATAVADMWKSLVLLICCQRPVHNGLVVTAPTNDSSEHHGVPVPCNLLRGGGTKWFQSSAPGNPLLIAIVASALLSFLLCAWLAQARQCLLSVPDACVQMRSVDRESDHTSYGLRQGARVVVSYHSDADGRQLDGNPAQFSHVYDITECSRYRTTRVWS